MTTGFTTQPPTELQAAGVRAVLFDVDGTLYSQPRLRALMAAQLALAAIRRPRQLRQDLRILALFRRTREELRALGAAARALENLQFSLVAERLGLDEHLVRTVVEEWMFRRPLPYLQLARQRDLDEVLAGLARRRIRIGALSDYPPDAKLAALGIERHFSLRLCTTDRSINAFKPHPKGFLVACEHWGLAPQEVLYVGDRPEVDAAGAAAAGTQCIIVGDRRWDGRRLRPGSAALGRFSDISRCVFVG